MPRRRFSSFLRAAGPVTLALVAVLAPGAAAALTVAADGETEYAVAVTPGAGEAAATIAADLAGYLGAVSGASFEVVEATPGSAQKVIGLRLVASAPEAPDSPEAYRIVRHGDSLWLEAAGERGLVYGAYRMLEKQLGVHWFEPGSPTVPRRAVVALQPRGWQAPRFAYREVFYRIGDNPVFAARNRLNGRFGHRLDKPIPAPYGGGVSLRQVGIFDLVPPAEYRASHPQFYGGGQLRFANEELRAVAKRRLREILAGLEEAPDYLLIAHADRETWFKGAPDAALIERFGAPSAAYVDFVRELACAVAADYPDTRILAQAYLWSREPPRGMQLPANMGVMLSGIARDFSQPMTAPVNRDFLRDLDGWATLTSHIIVWDYVTNFAGYIQPYPNLHTLGANIKALAARDAVVGVFSQGAYSTRGAEFDALRSWLLARLLWNPDQDADALMAEFVAGYFGPAAPYVADYIDALARAAKRWPGQLGSKAPSSAGYLDARFLRTADRLFEQAATAAAGQAPYARRVADARISVDYAVLANRERLSDSAWVNADARLQRLQQNLAAAEVRVVREGSDAGVAGLLQALAIDRGDAGRAEMCRGKPTDACRVVEDDALILSGGGAHLTADPAAADGGAAAMPGATTAWGIQLPLQEILPQAGQWRLYVIARAVPADGSEACALQVGVYPGTNHTAGCDPGAGYQAIQVPGSWSAGGGRYLWVAPVGDAAIEQIRVDRVVAVREGAA